MSNSVVRNRIRFGGFAGPDGYRFELSGGRLCLDFVNTVDHRPTPRARELIPTYGDLVSWLRQTKVLTPRESRALLRRARRESHRAERALASAHELREALFALFEAVASARTPPRKALAVLRSRLQTAFAKPVLDSGYALRWRDDFGTLDGPLSPVVRSAVELLSADSAERVRICAAEECAWAFLDESRNRSRQWCDMTVCGNRAKARRFYARRRRLKRRRGTRATRRGGGSS
jgi:predicted RNA-binding Zn ribbon-like protein